MFERIIRLIGEDKFKILSNSRVLILGLGGVGGYTVMSLVRSGIEYITIVDYDIVDISNINRQIIANVDTIGRKKTDIMREELLKINPNIEINIIDKKIDSDNYLELFENDYDYVIDACDTTIVKEKVIEYCLNNNIKIISSMGTGKKLNPMLFKIEDIRKTSYDPLAKRIRKYVKDNNIKGNIPVLYSTEKSRDTGDKIGSMCPVVGTAGMMIAGYVINDIIGNKI